MKRFVLILGFSLLFSLYATPYSYEVSTLIIDAGHGGGDPGAIGFNGLFEKDVNLAIALRLQEIVEKETDLKVVLTREDDTFISLEERVNIANSTFPGWNNSALFVSIHVNGSTSDTARGYEFLVKESMSRVPFISTMSPSWAVSYFAHDSFSTLNRLLNQASFALSFAVKSSFNDSFPDSIDRGVKEQEVYVLHNCVWPSLLVEAGFITHTIEGEKMTDPSWIDSVALSLFKGIEHYRSFLIP
ncbi:MAG: N-acetylmuramoyl-L-alanine amidase [Spirochaetia bacterium]|nr:N-acetylmuramoyl-L-alanine amidase [Spirochaetia bacterium]